MNEKRTPAAGRHSTIGRGLRQRAVNGGDDCYMTAPDDALELVTMALIHAPLKAAWIEPAAGDGVFLEAARFAGVERMTGYDLNPRSPDVWQANWFEVEPVAGSVVFGNPPFGFAASMAVRFFQHAATHEASVIAFILPGSFEKESIQRRLHPSYELADGCRRRLRFRLPQGGHRDVPCVMQVWRRLPPGQFRRHPPADDGADLFEFTRPENADVAVRRVGSRAGQMLNSVVGTKSTTYFLRVWRRDVLDALTRLDLSTVRDLTAGVRSVSKGELVAATRRALL